MFCMICGQALPDGAKFCKFCGTPQDAVSPTGTAQAENINLDGMHTFVPAMCPNCNAHMKVDSSSKVARCDACGTECLVQDAIKTLTVKGNVKVGSATINVSGTNTDSLLERVEIMLADGDFDGAIKKCDAILDSEPKNGKAYFYMLMANLKCRTRKDLANQRVPFDGNQYYSRAIQYGDDEQKTELIGYSKASKARLEADLKEKRKQASWSHNNYNEGQVEWAKKIAKERNTEFEVKRKNLNVGDEFYFGTYPKIGDSFFSGERVLWIALKIQDDKVLAISKQKILHEQRYHHIREKTTWRDCSLREWLNSDFLELYFSQSEKSRIVLSEIKTEKKLNGLRIGNVTTNDYVFLLSKSEAYSLFANDETKRIIVSDAVDYYWLRSPGKTDEYAMYVHHVIQDYGYSITHNCGVRPVMWIKLD